MKELKNALSISNKTEKFVRLLADYKPVINEIDTYEDKYNSVENQRKKIVDRYEDCKENLEELLEERIELYKSSNKQLEINERLDQRMSNSKLIELDDNIASTKALAEEYSNQIKVLDAQVVQLEKNTDTIYKLANEKQAELEEYVQAMFRNTMEVINVDTHILHKAQTEIAEELYMYRKNYSADKTESTDKFNFIHAIQKVLKEDGEIDHQLAEEFVALWQQWKDGYDTKMNYIIAWLTEYKILQPREAEHARHDIKQLIEANDFKNKMRGYGRNNQK